MSEGFIITGRENINRLRLLQIAAKLALEINTGLSSRVPMMNVAKAECGSPKRTKKGVLKDYTKWLESQIPGYEPNESVKKALSK